ncbi:MAG TPA: hypothetical protein DCQ53_01955 [Alphaproteobacteria bacterium]|jgi:hypothetical protein|nr:hypothetical protein [Alphaproteobacteria bacterium]
MPNVFVIALFLSLAASLLLAVRWGLARLSLTRDAREEYAARGVDRPATIAGISEPDFIRIYVSANEPRWALYAAGALLGAIVLTFPGLVILHTIWEGVRAATGASDVFAPGYYPWMFFMAFGLVGTWAISGMIAASLYYRRAPENFEVAMMRARGQPIEEVEIRRRRPKWARRARPD